MKFRSSAFIFILSSLTTSLFAQTGAEEITEEPVTDSTAIEEEAVPEKKVLRMTFESFKVNNVHMLKARVRSKVETKWTNTAGVEVSFYRDEIQPENLMVKDTSDELGEAHWTSATGFPQDTPAIDTYYAVVQDHPDYENVEETITVNPSVMEMELQDEDSMHQVKVFIGYPGENGEIVPLAETECRIYVKRLFGLLPVGDAGTTDEEGNMIVEFPANIQGGESGNIVVVAKVMDHELVGNVEVSKAISWGVPAVQNDFYHQRKLWSARSNSPVLLIVIANGIIIAIWAFIAFIFLEIFRINKLGRINR